jgi:hypothetical protein
VLTAGLWSQQQQLEGSPWLILGKGPSFAAYSPDRTSRYRTLALNHVAREVRCDAALMMDWDVFANCSTALLANAGFVLMPWHPHVDFRPAAETLEHFIAQNRDLARLDAERRLVVFNAETARALPALAGEALTPIKFFSAEAALNILAAGGAREVRTLGVDGGTAYSPDFADLDSVTRLANSRPDFNAQFRKFAETLRRHPQLLFGPLDLPAPVRIFIGSDATQLLGARLFEYSVRRHASISTQFEIIDNAGLPVPGDPARRARTGFSFGRLKIPQLCGYAGRAIYVDADMQVFTDIRDLWGRDFGDAWLLYSTLDDARGRTPQFSVMLLDCARLDWNAVNLVNDLDRGKYDYKGLMADFAMMPAERKQARLEFEWNSLERYEEGRTRLLHYTDMPTQPWVSHANRNGEIWYAELRRAIADGFIRMDEIHAAIGHGHVSPLLPEWAGLPPHPDGRQLAQGWIPPFRRFAHQAR